MKWVDSTLLLVNIVSWIINTITTSRYLFCYEGNYIMWQITRLDYVSIRPAAYSFLGKRTYSQRKLPFSK